MDAGVFFQDSNYPDDLPYELATKDDVAAAKLECEDEASASQKKNDERFVRPSTTMLTVLLAPTCLQSDANRKHPC